MTEFVCYCFRHTEQDIIDDLQGHKGVSTILDRITEAKSRGQCNCDVNHPEHR